jgi:hypothetical protein
MYMYVNVQTLGRFAVKLRFLEMNGGKAVAVARSRFTIALGLLSFFALFSSTGAQEALTVILVDGEKRTEMKYTDANRHGQVSGIGVFTQVKSYLTLDGQGADVRTKNPSPQFEFWLQSAMNAKTTVLLVKLDRRSKQREIRLSKAKGRDASTGFPIDHILPVTLEEISSNGSMTNYRVSSQSPLPPGEYAIVRHPNLFFDFGIDK